MAPAEHGYPDGLEVLERARQVEEGLRPGAHGHDRMVRQGVEVGGDVTGGLGAAVHTADAPGGEDPYPRVMGQRDGGRDRCRAERPALRDGDGHVPLGNFAGLPEYPLMLRDVEADPRHPVEHGRHRRHCAM